MSIEAMKLALEALHDLQAEDYEGFEPTLTALCQAIEQAQKQEPTRSQKMRDAGMTRRPKGWDKDGDDSEQPFGWLYLLVIEGQVVNEKFTSVNWDTRYEPFGRHNVDHGGEVIKTPLYTSPPQRQPLTDEQWQEIANLTGCLRIEKRGRDAIMRIFDEAAHGIKEKNT